MLTDFSWIILLLTVEHTNIFRLCPFSSAHTHTHTHRVICFSLLQFLPRSRAPQPMLMSLDAISVDFMWQRWNRIMKINKASFSKPAIVKFYKSFFLAWLDLFCAAQHTQCVHTHTHTQTYTYAGLWSCTQQKKIPSNTCVPAEHSASLHAPPAAQRGE